MIWRAVLALIIGLAITPGTARASVRSEVIRDHDYEFKLMLNNSGEVTISTLRSAQAPPPQMSLTIYSDPSTSQTIQVRALGQQAGLQQYQGRLDSIVG